MGSRRRLPPARGSTRDPTPGEQLARIPASALVFTGRYPRLVISVSGHAEMTGCFAEAGEGVSLPDRTCTCILVYRSTQLLPPLSLDFPVIRVNDPQ